MNFMRSVGPPSILNAQSTASYVHLPVKTRPNKVETVMLYWPCFTDCTAWTGIWSSRSRRAE